MSRRISLFASLMLALGCFMPVTAARGDFGGDLLTGLDFAGFQFNGQQNPLSNGLGLSAAQNFQNTLLDFGASELTLTGPVALSVTTGNRGFRTFDFNFIAGNDANPLLYSFVSDVGGTAVRIDGSSVVDASGSINQFGWYDMTLDVSSRQTYSSTGRFANSDGDNIDYDIGPVRVRGNIFADLLASLTDPLFEAAGAENFFGSFSGRTIEANALTSTVSGTRAKAAAGKFLSANEISMLVHMAAQPQAVPGPSFFIDADSNPFAGRSDESSARNAIPEPATLALLLAPAALLRRRNLR